MFEQTINIDRMEQAVALFGTFDENIKIIQNEYLVSVTVRGSELKISGDVENVSKAVLKNYRMNSNLILLIKEDGKSILLLYDKSEYTYTAAPSFQTTNAYAGLPFEKTRNGKQ